MIILIECMPRYGKRYKMFKIYLYLLLKWIEDVEKMNE